MSFCVAYGCRNARINTDKVALHRFPTDKVRYNAWVSAIGRTELPKSGRFCSEHFSPECYDKISQLKIDLCPELIMNKNTRPKLKPDAIPTKFCHRKTASSRPTSTSDFFLLYRK